VEVNLFKGKIAAFCVVGLTLGSGLLGCTSQELFSREASKKTQDQANISSNTATNTNEARPAPASSSPATDNAPTSVVEPISRANDSLPAGYILDQSCEKGTGQTGLDIYYRLAPSDSLRYACVHRIDANPYINYADSTFAENLADVGGPFCAFSSISNNVGCALTPITPTDLMNVAAPQEEEQPVRSERPKQSEQPKQSKQTVEREQPKQSKQTVEREQPTPDQQPSPSNNGTGGLSNDNHYTNSKGNDVHSPAHSTDNSVPSGAAAQCADGEYSFSESRSGTCSSHGGVSQWLK
jgi:hypothetical protein